MSAKVYSAAVQGLEGILIEVEADVSRQLPGMAIVGLPDKAVDEAKERVRSAITNSGAQFPRQKVTINLAPGDIKKEGPAYDLPIAVSTLAISSQLNLETREQLFVGELSLEGILRPINGVLPVAMMARAKGINKVFLPKANAAEAAIVEGLEIYPVDSLNQLIRHFQGQEKIQTYQPIDLSPFFNKESDSEDDFANICGQENVKRALEIAAAGGHNILMIGPPGAGKTMLAKAIATILPRLTLAEALEVTKIYSVAGLLPASQPLIFSRPFRNPHHTASGVALVGGGTWPKPGEISLAHRGVLFLDEFPEFPRSVLENLRQPLEEGAVSVSRAAGTLQFPAQFILVAAMNPCPCGYLTDPKRGCVCGPSQIIKYQKKISGPLLDRIDLHIEVPPVQFEKLTAGQGGESSARVRERVQLARDRQLNRFKDSGILINAEMSTQHLKEFCKVDQTTMDLLRQAVSQFNLSARAYHRILKLARTIADLAGVEMIKTEHAAEALQYRPKVE